MTSFICRALAGVAWAFSALLYAGDGGVPSSAAGACMPPMTMSEWLRSGAGEAAVYTVVPSSAGVRFLVPHLRQAYLAARATPWGMPPLDAWVARVYQHACRPMLTAGERFPLHRFLEQTQSLAIGIEFSRQRTRTIYAEFGVSGPAPYVDAVSMVSALGLRQRAARADPVAAEADPGIWEHPAASILIAQPGGRIAGIFGSEAWARDVRLVHAWPAEISQTGIMSFDIQADHVLPWPVPGRIVGSTAAHGGVLWERWTWDMVSSRESDAPLPRHDGARLSWRAPRLEESRFVTSDDFAEIPDDAICALVYKRPDASWSRDVSDMLPEMEGMGIWKLFLAAAEDIAVAWRVNDAGQSALEIAAVLQPDVLPMVEAFVQVASRTPSEAGQSDPAPASDVMSANFEWMGLRCRAVVRHADRRVLMMVGDADQMARNPGFLRHRTVQLAVQHMPERASLVYLDRPGMVWAAVLSLLTPAVIQQQLGFPEEMVQDGIQALARVEVPGMMAISFTETGVQGISFGLMGGVFTTALALQTALLYGDFVHAVIRRFVDQQQIQRLQRETEASASHVVP